MVCGAAGYLGGRDGHSGVSSLYSSLWSATLGRVAGLGRLYAEHDGPVLAALCGAAGHCAAGDGWVGVARMWRFLIALSAHTSEAVLSGSRMSSTAWLPASPIGAALDLLRRFEEN